jgi:hypothetical protein
MSMERNTARPTGSFLIGGALCAGITFASQAFAAPSSPDSCPVTRPNGATYTQEPAGGNHGNEFLITGLWPNGIVEVRSNGPGQRLADGALMMKFFWWRLVEGELSLSGRRLDALAAPLRAQIPRGYGKVGFQASGLIFPTPGCCEVTRRVGNGSLTFVTRVVGDP